MPGYLIQRGRQGEDLLRRQRPGRDHRGHRGLAHGERPGLVNHQRGAPGQALQHAAVLDHHPAPRRRGQPRHQGDRRRQDQRARRGDDQDGDRPLRASHGPGGPGHGQGQRQEPRRVPVGEPDERRLRVLRLGNQADDARVGAVRGVRRGAQVERSARVHGAAADAVARAVLDRHGLAGQRGLVQHRDPRGHGTVYGEHVAGRHEQHIAYRDLIERHRLQRPAAVPPGGPGGAGQQGVQVMPRTLVCPRLQRPPAGQHDADHRRCQQLAGRHCAGQGEQRDQIDADAAVPDAVDRGPQRVADPAGRRRQPGRVSDRTVPGQARQPACGQARGGQYEQHQRRTATQPRPCPPGNTPHHAPSLQRGRRDGPGPEGPVIRAVRTSSPRMTRSRGVHHGPFGKNHPFARRGGLPAVSTGPHGPVRGGFRLFPRRWAHARFGLAGRDRGKWPEVNSSKVTIRLAAVQTRSLPGQVEAKCGRPGQCRIGGTLVPLMRPKRPIALAGARSRWRQQGSPRGHPGVPESGEEDQR